MDALPYNPGIEKAADGLAAAHHAYGVLGAVVLFVVHDPEPNIFDQLWLSDYLFDVHSIETVRLTFSQILEMAELDSARRLVLNGKEVSVVYFRTGYVPINYQERGWEARKMLERSRAIKCPTVITQLVGSKKVQQVLTEQGVVERYARKVLTDVGIFRKRRRKKLGRHSPKFIHWIPVLEVSKRDVLRSTNPRTMSLNLNAKVAGITFSVSPSLGS